MPAVSASDTVAVSDAASRNPQSKARSAGDTPLTGGMNRSWNPSAEVNAGSYHSYTYLGGSVINSQGRVTTDAFRGAACFEVNFTAGSTPQVESNVDIDATDLLAAGTIVFCRIAVKITGQINANSQIQGMFRGNAAAGGGFLFENQYGGKGALGIVKPPVSGQWYEMFGTATVPTGTGALQVACFVSGLTNGQTYTLHVDGNFACQTPTVDTFFPYNDGDSPGWRWVGPVGYSTSRSTSPDLAAIAPLNLPRTGTDTVAASDAAAGQRALVRAVGDSDAVSDAAARGVTFARSAVDTATEGDGATRVVSLQSGASDAVACSDVAPANTAKVRQGADAVATSDSASRLVTIGGAASDTLAASDAAGRLAGLLRSISETVVGADAASRGPVSRYRAATDTLVALDSAGRLVVLHCGGLDSLAASDAASQRRGLVRSALDNLTVTDRAARFLTLGKVTRDTVTLVDVAARRLRLGDGASDTMTVADSATVVVIGLHRRSGPDFVAVTDSAARALLTLWKVARDTVPLAEVATGGQRLGDGASDTTTVADGAVAYITFGRRATDLIAVFDSAGSLIHLRPDFPVLITSDVVPSVPMRGAVRLAESMVPHVREAIVMDGSLAVGGGS